MIKCDLCGAERERDAVLLYEQRLTGFASLDEDGRELPTKLAICQRHHWTATEAKLDPIAVCLFQGDRLGALELMYDDVNAWNGEDYDGVHCPWQRGEMRRLAEGTIVRAKMAVYDLPPDTTFKHADPGEFGTVTCADINNSPTVTFWKSETSSCVTPEEVEALDSFAVLKVIREKMMDNWGVLDWIDAALGQLDVEPGDTLYAGLGMILKAALRERKESK